MINNIITIIEFYLENLDREYDTDQVLLTEKILGSLNNVKEDMNKLLLMIPEDISDELKELLKTL